VTMSTRLTVATRTRAAVTAGIVLAGVLCASPVARAGKPSREQRIKAAFLYQFTKFVKWPSEALGDSDAPVQVCVLGADPFGSALDALDGKQTQGRKVAVRRVKTVDDALGCHLLFVGITKRSRLRDALSSLGGKPVLTVGDMPGFAKHGGMINFIVKNNKVRFEINTDATERSGLSMSSRLLALAQIVSDSES